MPFPLNLSACVRLFRTRRPSLLLAISPLLVGLIGAAPVRAVSVSAYYNNLQPVTNSLGLLPKFPNPGILQPGLAQCQNGATLTAPAPNSFLTATLTYNNCMWGSILNPAYMSGDAVSTITNLGLNNYDISLTLTNLSLNSTSVPPPAKEYIYVKLWENFIGLPVSSTATWSGSLSAAGTYMRTNLNDILGIEPIATVYDSGSLTWVAASSFFGGIPGGLSGTFLTSTSVNNLSPYIFGGGNLRVGVETILLLNNLDGLGGDQIVLPTSLDLKMRLQDPVPPSTVPAPLAGLGAAAGWGWSRRLRRRQSKALRSASLGASTLRA